MIVVDMETILVNNDAFLSYQNVCIYRLGQLGINTLAAQLPD